ncbi:hypothetical protein TUM4442_16510 [Shewanella algae]|nr:hypothetical protein TUM4442_16510 [Shewanella algae]
MCFSSVVFTDEYLKYILLFNGNANVNICNLFVFYIKKPGNTLAGGLKKAEISWRPSWHG